MDIRTKLIQFFSSTLGETHLRQSWFQSHQFVVLFLVLNSLFLSACIHITQACTGACDRGPNIQDPEAGGEKYVFDPTAIDVMPHCQSLDLQHRKQQTSSWCWASSTQSVINYIKVGFAPLIQCDLANTMFERDVADARAQTNLPDINCCKATDEYVPGMENPDIAINSRIVCQHGAWPDDVLTKYNFGYDPPRLYPPDGGGLSWDELVEEICQSRPVIFVIRWQYDGRPDGYHTGVVRGYRQPQDGSQWVEYYDAGADGFVVMSYEKWFLGSSNDFSHEVDYLKMRNL